MKQKICLYYLCTDFEFQDLKTNLRGDLSTYFNGPF